MRGWLAGLTVVSGVLLACSDRNGSLGDFGAVRDAYAAEDERLRSEFPDGIRIGKRVIPVSTGVAPGYVPDGICTECHIMDRNPVLGMQRAYAKATPAAIIEEFDDAHYYHEASDRHYEATHDGETLTITRYQLDEDGSRYNELSRAVDDVMGSGNKCRAYLYRTPGDELYQLPLAWYSDDRIWRMSPGYEHRDHIGFQRQITHDCMFCHNAYPELPQGSDLIGQRPHFPAELPQGIGCQRCHGPGAEHVVAANDGERSLEEIRGHIYNPVGEDPEREIETCLQCHLQPDSSTLSIVRRMGRPIYGYRPEQELGDYLEHVDHDGGERFQINHHAYRLLESRCYTESEGRLTCLACHDPHTKTPVAERDARFRGVCLSCHQLEECDTAAMGATPGEEASCVGCHMPQRRSEDVIEVVVTDHKIQRTPPAGDLTTWRPRGPTRSPGQTTAFAGARHGERTLACDVSDAARGEGRAVEALLEAVRSGAVTDVDALMCAAVGQSKSDYAAAAKSYAQALEAEPDHPGALRMLGLTLVEAGKPREALAYLERAGRADPGDAEVAYYSAVAHHRLGDRDAALAGFRRALELRPLYEEAHLGLGALLGRMGQFEPAAEHYRWAHRIDPLRTEAYYLRGVMLALGGDREAAATSWRRGRRAAPEDPILMFAAATGRLYANDGNGALKIAEKARSAGAAPASCSLVEALAHHRLGRVDAAREAWTRASEGAPPAELEAVLHAILAREAAALFGDG